MSERDAWGPARVFRWAPYSWLALPIVTAIATARYGWPVGFVGWLPFVGMALALVAVERGCLLLFSTGSRDPSQPQAALHSATANRQPRDLGYQLTLALGFSVVLWCFREFMNPMSG